MSESGVNIDHLLDLAGVICDEIASQDDFAELDSLVLADEASCCRYLDYCRLHGVLRFELRAHRAAQRAHQQINIESAIAAVDDSSVARSKMSSPTPFLGSLSTALHGTIDNFVFISSGWPLAYMVATVILGIGLLAGSRIYVSRPVQVAEQPLPSSRPVVESKANSVGRITGMTGCRWADSNTATVHGVRVFLGRKYALASGLVEITYDTGAKVILQGPVTYEVESPAGGFLSFGKLTAKVEKKSDAANQTSQIRNQPLFAVRTPTATVIDLGTEFGVEVNKAGGTLSHVYRGAIRIQLSAPDAQGQSQSIALGENESARAERTEGPRPSLTLRRVSSSPKTFVRQIQPEATPSEFVDLLDIMARGNGDGHRRECGIDPLTGMEDPSFVPSERPCDGKYYRTIGRLIDGVFTVGAGGGPAQLDSAGHVFRGFPKTSGQTCGSIWARAAAVRPQDRAMWQDHFVKYTYWVYSIHPALDEKFMPENRGLLGLHSNAGITFDLEAIRRLHGGRRLARFCATAGKDCSSLAEIWVFIDGRLQVRHMLKPTQALWSGTSPIDVAISPTDRFLTLTTTDGGDGIKKDWVVFGDPVLQWATKEPPEKASR
jgi:hypothetical protein